MEVGVLAVSNCICLPLFLFLSFKYEIGSFNMFSYDIILMISMNVDTGNSNEKKTDFLNRVQKNGKTISVKEIIVDSITQKKNLSTVREFLERQFHLTA